SCQSQEGSTSSGLAANTASGSWSGTFTAYVDGTFKDGIINVQYEADSKGEFEIDDTNGPLGGTKKMSYSSRGTQSTVTSTHCSGDTLKIQHDLRTGDVTFDGVVCGTRLTQGSGKMAKQN